MTQLQLRRCCVDVDGERQLLALVATCGTSSPSAAIATAAAAADNDTATSANSSDDTSTIIDTAAADAIPQVDDVLVYLHGFPDMSVHPTRLEFASRMPRKLAEAWLSSCSCTGSARAASSSSSRTSTRSEDDSTSTSTSTPARRTAAFVAFNFGGVPGSDNALCFTHKTISKEVEDAIAVCGFVRQRLLRAVEGAEASSTSASSDTSSSRDTNKSGRVHLVGLSTGAIVASLLRNRGVADSIAVIAGLADVASGVTFDFSPTQLAQCERDGACWKEFYLPGGAPLPLGVALSLDGETPAPVAAALESHTACSSYLPSGNSPSGNGDSSGNDETLDSRTSDATDDGTCIKRNARATVPLVDTAAPRKLFLRLDRAYVDECRSGALDIRHAVSSWPSSPLSLVSETQTQALEAREASDAPAPAPPVASLAHNETQQCTTTAAAVARFPPLLMIHGDADTNVPIQNGEALFQVASEPKTFVRIARANHLLTNTKHLKRALAAILVHTAAQSSS